MRDTSSGKSSVLYDAKEAISQLKAPVIKDPKVRKSKIRAEERMNKNVSCVCIILAQGVEPSESTSVWGELSQSILSRNWQKAREVKNEIEEKERMLTKERKSKGESWSPRYFTSSKTKEDRWECWPKQQSVPPGPLIV